MARSTAESNLGFSPGSGWPRASSGRGCVAEPELAGGLLGDVPDQLIGYVGENLVHEPVAAGVVVGQCHRFGEAAAIDGDDALRERFPRKAVSSM